MTSALGLGFFKGNYIVLESTIQSRSEYFTNFIINQSNFLCYLCLPLEEISMKGKFSSLLPLRIPLFRKEQHFARKP